MFVERRASVRHPKSQKPVPSQTGAFRTTAKWLHPSASQPRSKMSAMRISGLLFLPCYAVLLGCEQPSEHPEVAYRYCMAELARESARTGEVTFEEATAFSHECQRFAVEAATLRSREELGAKFDAQSSETASHIRDNLQMIVRAHVCAFASERDLQRCTPIM